MTNTKTITPNPTDTITSPQPSSYSGVVPSLAQVAELGPPRSEIGVGGLMPWAGKLYVLNYNSHKEKSGRGVSLRVIDKNMQMQVEPQTLAVDGTYTNRFVHYPTNKLVLGPHVIDDKHNIHTIEQLRPLRVCGTTYHLNDPDNKCYVLCMEGELFELDLNTYECKQIADLCEILSTEGEGKVHFKDCYCDYGRLVVCSNEYFEEDWKRKRQQGRLAQWDGNPQNNWTILERKPFATISGRHQFGQTIFATGWDQASAILKVFTDANKTWTTYRLPKASHCFDHKWQTEWPRIREVEHERFLMDCHGMFYELSPWAYGARIWGVRPISTHLWVLGDFCSWRGMLVMGADNASPSHGMSPTTAEPQSGLWFGKTDDLWQFGKPKGWGGPWWEEQVKAGAASDPYLMTGFDKKCLHVSQKEGGSLTVDIEIDFQGDGKFHKYQSLEINKNGYACYNFPDGFSAHWVRLVADSDCIISAQFHYT